MWVVSGTGGGISRIDPATNLVTPIPVQQATSVAVGEGGVWITNQETGAVTEYSPDGSQLRRTIEVGGTPTAIAVGEGAIWVADVAHQTVVRLDPVSGAKVATVPIGWPPFGIAVGAGGVWVAGPDIEFNCC